MIRKIAHRGRKQQIIDFAGVEANGTSPSDLDACIEYRRSAWVFVEMKLYPGYPATGQKRMLQELACDMWRAGKPCMVILSAHAVDDSEADIEMASCFVWRWLVIRSDAEARRAEYGHANGWTSPGWCEPPEEMTVADAVAWFLARHRTAEPIADSIATWRRGVAKVAAAKRLMASRRESA